MKFFFRAKRGQSDLLDAIDRYIEVEKVAPDAPIHQILAAAPVQSRINSFVRADRLALRKQARHWNAGSMAWVAGALGVIVVPLELLPLAMWLPSWSPGAITVARVLGIIFMFGAIVLLGRRRSRRHWKDARVDAETMRGEIFREIIERAGNQPVRLLQALACFRVAHLEWQLNFYAARLNNLPARLNEEWWRALPFKILGYAFSISAAVLGSVAVLNFAIQYAIEAAPTAPYLTNVRGWIGMLDASRWHDGLYAASATLLAFAGSRFVTFEDYSNAALYPWARDELERLNLELPDVQQKAAQGDVHAVQEFRKRVQDILEREHAVWSGATLPPELREHVV